MRNLLHPKTHERGGSSRLICYHLGPLLISEGFHMELTLKAAVREGTGKGVARQLRAQNRVPAILYGSGLAPMALHVDARDLSRVLHTEAGLNALIDLEIEGEEPHLTLARELQQDHIKGRMIHVDFLAIRRDQKITVSVPIEITGASVGVHEGGVTEHHLWELELECLPGAVPSSIEVDITALNIGDSIVVADIAAPEGADIKTDPSVMVIAVVQPQKPVEEEEVVAVEGELAEGETAEDAPAEEGGED